MPDPITGFFGSYGSHNVPPTSGANQCVAQFLPEEEQKAKLYKGVDEYWEKDRAYDLREFSKKFPEYSDSVQDGPFFFRKALKHYLNNKSINSGAMETTTLKEFLGDDLALLYKLARKEERFDKGYINSVFAKSVETVDGAKWGKRPIATLFGPSASGKSFVKNQVLDEINSRTEKQEDSENNPSVNRHKNGIIFSDGGIERDVSEVRKLMVAIGVKNNYKDITDIDKVKIPKLKKNILNAAILNKELGIVLVDTVAKYAYGNMIGDIISGGGQRSLLLDLEKIPQNTIIPICVIGEDDATLQESVSFMGNSRSQAKEKHVKELENEQIKLEKFPQYLPEFKKYQASAFNAGVDGSKRITDALVAVSKDKSALYCINDLVLKKLDKKGVLTPGSESIEGTIAVSNRIFKEWSKKTEVQRLDAGFKAFCVDPDNGKNTLHVLQQADGTWTQAGSDQLGVVMVNPLKFTEYNDANNKHSIGFSAYVKRYSTPLIHTSGEYNLFLIKKEIEGLLTLKNDKGLSSALEELNRLNIGGGPVESMKKLDRVIDYPALIDQFERKMTQLEGEIDISLHSRISSSLNQIKNEVNFRREIAEPKSSSEQRMIYDVRELYGIQTKIEKRGEAAREPIPGATELQQAEAQEVVFMGDRLNQDQIIVSEAKYTEGTLRLEQDNTGKVLDKSTGGLTNEQKQLTALKQAQMLLNNYDPKKGKIVIKGTDSEQTQRLYAAVLYFVRNDPEIKKRMGSSRWILPDTYSPEKLIKCNVLGFVPPDTLSKSYIEKHLPIIKTMNKAEISVLSVNKRESLEHSVMTDQPVEIVRTHQNAFKAQIRECHDQEEPSPPPDAANNNLTS